MKDVSGENIWDIPKYYVVSAICITTNGVVKHNGAAVMGRGIALQAKQCFSEIEFILGSKIKANGNVVQELCLYKEPQSRLLTNTTYFEIPVVAFPVKENWWEKASLLLIKRSCDQLRQLMIARDWKNYVLLPRPGCGNGGLDWNMVKPAIESLLPQNVMVVTENK